MLIVYLSIAVVTVLRKVSVCDRWLLVHKTTGGGALESQT
jgi:hypothetical protein